MLNKDRLVFARTILPNGPITLEQHLDMICYAKALGKAPECYLGYYFPHDIGNNA